MYRHLVNLVDTDGSQSKKRGRPLKKRDKPSDYQSAIACHLAENKACRQKYLDDIFMVLSRARRKSHNALEAYVKTCSLYTEVIC